MQKWQHLNKKYYVHITR